MTVLATYTKQPDEVKDYDVDYSEWLLPMGDTLDQVDPTVECLTDPSDTSLEVRDLPVSITATACKLWMRGGTNGARYKVTLQATTVGGRLDESELIFKIKDY